MKHKIVFDGYLDLFDFLDSVIDNAEIQIVMHGDTAHLFVKPELQYGVEGLHYQYEVERNKVVEAVNKSEAEEASVFVLSRKRRSDGQEV